MTQRRIVLFSDSRGWHETRLRRAFLQRRAEVARVSLRDCRIGPGAAHCFGLDIPGCERLPDAAFVRFIPGGSFEQVTFRLDILHALSACGVRVYNDARTIERTVDKAMTSFLLHRAGVPSPPLWVCESAEQARAIQRYETAAGRRLVLKPLFGSRGKGLRLLDAASELPPPEDMEGVYYLQGFVPGMDAGGRDWRVMVIGGRAVAAMERRSRHWITNRSRGGRCHRAALDSELAALAERAVAAVAAAYAGVDIVRDRQGRYQVLEVNGIPAWQGLQSVCDLDLAGLLADDLLARLPAPRIEAAS